MEVSEAVPISPGQGLEIRPGLLERLISRLPLPFWLSSLLLALLFGLPGFLVFRYLDTSQPLSDSMETFFHGLLPAGIVRQVAGLVLWTVFFYLALVLPRYIRIKIIQAEAKISSLVPEGIDGYRGLFQPLAYTIPVILFGAGDWGLVR